MPENSYISLSKLRLEIAEERLSTARFLLGSNDYKSVANRSYYAVFSAMRAVLALDKFDSKKHSGVISEFRKRYIKTGILDSELSYIIDSLVEVRQGSDYNDFYVISKDEVVSQIEKAQFFIDAVKEYLSSQYQ